jgi:sulfonate transport system ATP-binding protein
MTETLSLQSETYTSQAAVRVRGLSRRFGNRPPVLHALDLTIAPGEFVALLGHSGSGKSTLLRALAGLDPITEGEVTIPEKISVVFQESRLLPWKTVQENVALARNDATHAQTIRLLDEVGLTHRQDAWPLTLSGGEAQRAALARALIREPAFLMLDEPFAALDALTRLHMQALVTTLWQRHHSAVLLVTHDVDEALSLADRAIVLDKGRIRLDLPIPLGRPRHHADPAFETLRTRLLEELGVHA